MNWDMELVSCWRSSALLDEVLEADTEAYLWLSCCAAEVETARESMANMVTTCMSPTVIVPATSRTPQLSIRWYFPSHNSMRLCDQPVPSKAQMHFSPCCTVSAEQCQCWNFKPCGAFQIENFKVMTPAAQPFPPSSLLPSPQYFPKARRGIQEGWIWNGGVDRRSQ